MRMLRGIPTHTPPHPHTSHTHHIRTLTHHIHTQHTHVQVFSFLQSCEGVGKVHGYSTAYAFAFAMIGTWNAPHAAFALAFAFASRHVGSTTVCLHAFPSFLSHSQHGTTHTWNLSFRRCQDVKLQQPTTNRPTNQDIVPKQLEKEQTCWQAGFWKQPHGFSI